MIDQTAGDERIVINMGPQHPSTHGVLRLVLELQGEVVTDARLVIGYLHTGIEKNCEYRTWTQGVTFVTRADYLAPLFNETAYCLSTERLLGIEVPDRAATIRVLLMEINRIGSHLVALATGGMELGALTGMTNGFREREEVLHLLEFLTGLRMNHAFIRPGGVVQDLPEGHEERIRSFIKVMRGRLPGFHKLLTGNRIWRQRLEGVGYLPLDGCLALGVTGPILRSAGLAWDLREVEPVPRVRALRLRGPHRHRRRQLRPLRAAGRGDEPVAADHRAGPRPARAGPGDGRGRQDRVARQAVDRRRRHGQLPRPRPQDHGPVDGVADPPLQAGHRGLQGAAGPGLRADRVAPRRARARTWSPTAAPARCACTCATPAS